MTPGLYNLTQWDREVFFLLNNGMKCALLDRLMPLITNLGLGHVQALIVFLIAGWMGMKGGTLTFRHGGRVAWRGFCESVRDQRVWVGPLFVALVISGVTVIVIKESYSRDRPWWFYEQEHEAGRFLSSHVKTVEGVYPVKVRGFPSGHTATTLAMATVLTQLYVLRRCRKREALAIALTLWTLAGLVALSRIYLGSHWPLDVIGGAVVGIASGAAAIPLCRR